MISNAGTEGLERLLHGRAGGGDTIAFLKIIIPQYKNTNTNTNIRKIIPQYPMVLYQWDYYFICGWVQGLVFVVDLYLFLSAAAQGLVFVVDL